MFTYIGGPPLCQACVKKMDEKFEEVKKYVYDNPGCGIQEVCDAMDVTSNQIRKWIREERLAFAESSDVAINCEKCGKRILTGRFCENCKREVVNQFGNASRKPEPAQPERKKTQHDGNRMRFLDN
jgi:ribosomal protein L32